MWFGSNGSVKLLTVWFTVNELYKFIGSVRLFSVQIGTVCGSARFMAFF
jgi:hypothetical protein